MLLQTDRSNWGSNFLVKSFEIHILAHSRDGSTVFYR